MTIINEDSYDLISVSNVLRPPVRCRYRCSECRQEVTDNHAVVKGLIRKVIDTMDIDDKCLIIWFMGFIGFIIAVFVKIIGLSS